MKSSQRTIVHNNINIRELIDMPKTKKYNPNLTIYVALTLHNFDYRFSLHCVLETPVAKKFVHHGVEHRLFRATNWDIVEKL